jgi:two-component system, cell cycle sensor histidine kinase and response regulator CckA
MNVRRTWRRIGDTLTSGPGAVALAAAIVGGVVFLAVWVQVGWWRDQRDLQVRRTRVTSGVSVQRSALVSALANRFALLEGLRAFVELKLASGERLEDQYEAFASRLYTLTRGTRNLAVAQGTTYRLVYPLAGNEQIVGYDLLADDRAEVVEDTRRAMARPGVTVSGPYELKQGGIGLVAREAVWVGGRYWGLVAMAMDLEPILEDARLTRLDAGLTVALRRPGRKPFLGDESPFASQPVIERVDLPDGHWELAAHPTGGWEAAGAEGRRLWLLSGFIIALVPMGLLFQATWRMRVLRAASEDAERRVQEGTAALARTADLLRAILRASPLPIVAFDTHGRVQVWNEAAERVFGWSAEETIGSPNPLITSENRAAFDAIQDRVQKGEMLSGIEVQRRLEDGRLIDMRLFTARMVDVDGRPAGVMGVVEDVSGPKRMALDLQAAREARREVELRLQTMLDTIQVLAVMLDRDGRVTFCNQTVVSVTGWPRDELIGRDWFETCIPPGVREALRAQFRASLGGGGVQGEQESPILSRHGSVSEISWQNTMLTGASGRVEGTASFGRDVTDQRQLEAQYRQAQKMEAVGQLAGGIAHDFNNLLQVVSGYTALALAEVGPGQPLHPELTEIGRAAERATVLVRQLLAFSRRQKIERRPIDINATIADLLKMLRRLIGEHIELDFRPGYGVAPVLADPGLLEQVLMNLCVNARDVMPDGGRIGISTANVTVDREFVERRAWGQEGEYVLLTVTDTGPGIPPALRERIFEPFFTTKDVGKGTGLGLATVYGIVKQHEGMIEVARDVSVGAEFRIYLPLAPAATSAEAEPRGPAEVAAGGHETILLAEDEELVRNLARRVLERAGYRVLQARDGEEALAMVTVHAREIDLALLDVVMPRAGGREVAARLRALRPGMPIIFSTGYSRQVLDESWAPDEGVELILKPYEPKLLLQRVRARLGRAKAG